MKKLLLLILLFSVQAVPAQHTLKKAEAYFAEYDYPNAAKAYEAYLKGKEKPTGTTLKHVADTYFYLNDFAKAERQYAQLYMKYGNALEERQFLNYIHSLRAQRKYDSADELLAGWYRTRKKNVLLDRMEHQKAYLDSLGKQQSRYSITNIKGNSPLADFGAVFYGSRVVYSSGHDTIGTGGRIYKRNSQPFLKLYVAGRHPEDGGFFGEREFLPQSQSRYHNASACFSADGTTMYFSTNTVSTRDNLLNDSKGTNNLRLLRGTIREDKLEDVAELPINSKRYSVSHPALSPDGQWLYFVSDMPGGYGETDIYKIKVNSDGTYGKPQNLGEAINTSGKEMFPYVQHGRLYFASEGHYGLGGLDVFESQIAGEAYTAPKNLGLPVNSNRDDFAYVTDATGSFGYFSSNRAGGRGDDDIYAFTKETPPCSRVLSGTVTDAVSGSPVNKAVVNVYDTDDSLLAATRSGSDGHYTIELPCKDGLRAEAEKEGNVSQKNPVPLVAGPLHLKLVDYSLLVSAENGEEKVKVNPIFFEFDKFTINAAAAAELDKVVFVLRSFPSVIIKIESHTDSRGEDAYNLELSAGRAKATYNYILSRGISPEQIESVMGYGETRLINSCGNGASCTEEEHLRNRRSEFIIVSK